MLDVVGHVLGEEFLLSSFTANIAKPGGVPMALHTDQWWAPEPTRRGRRPLPVGSMTRSRFDHDAALGAAPPPTLAPAAVSNVLVMLDGMTTANGGTRVVPGSHLAGRHPDPARDGNVATVAAEGPPGCAIITDGRLWHGTGANTGDSDRAALILTFAARNIDRKKITRSAPGRSCLTIYQRAPVPCWASKCGGPMVDRRPNGRLHRPTGAIDRRVTHRRQPRAPLA